MERSGGVRMGRREHQDGPGPLVDDLISALTGVPIRQGLAITGAVDQHGNILPIGSATEKIEGFFDACEAIGFAEGQGLLIPESNSDELMLRPDVVDAVAEGRFRIVAIARIEDAISVLTGRDAGTRADGDYPPGSVLAEAVTQARSFYEASVQWASGRP